ETPLDDEHVVAHDPDPVGGEPGDHGALPAAPIAENRPGALARHERAGVEALASDPVAGDGRHRCEERVDELRDAEPAREAEARLTRRAVDDDLAAAAELERRPALGHHVDAAVRVPDGGADPELGPALVDLAEQRCGLVDVREAKPVGAHEAAALERWG